MPILSLVGITEKMVDAAENGIEVCICSEKYGCVC